LEKEDCQFYLNKYIQQGILPEGVYLSDSDSTYAAYNENRDVVGICALAINDDDEWEVNSLVVDKNYQRQGYGRAIVDRLVEMSRDLNPSSTLYYGVEYENVRAMMDFYAKYNPIYTGVERGSWGGQAEFCIDCRDDRSQPNPHIIEYLKQHFDDCNENEETLAIGQHTDYQTYLDYGTHGSTTLQ